MPLGFVIGHGSFDCAIGGYLDKTRHHGVTQDKTSIWLTATRQDTTGQDRTGPDATRRRDARQDEYLVYRDATGQDWTRHDVTRQDTTGRDTTRQDETSPTRGQDETRIGP